MPTKNKPSSTTAFSEAVRQVVRTIPKGQVLTYGEVASRAGHPGAARAVASVMSSNYDPDIPCHRVVLGSGQVGEYNRGGTKKKLALLIAEGWNQQLS